MATFLVIGLGRFGTSLALRLMDLGNEVMVVDTNEETINHIAPSVTEAKIGDCMDEELLSSLGVDGFDYCFVCIGQQFQASLEIVSQLKELGAPKVIAKADRDLHARLLLKIGADEVVFPERDMGQRTAMRFTVSGAKECVELSPGYAIFELAVPSAWVGRDLIELDIRNRWKINVIGVREDGDIRPITSAKYTFQKDTCVLVAGGMADVLRMMKNPER